MKINDKVKNFCNECQHETWHNVLFVERTNGSCEEISWSKDFIVLKCAGCDNVCFKTEASDSESYDVDEFGNWIPDIYEEHFPASNEGLGNIENIYEIPVSIKLIYSETIKAITDGCYTLAGIGLRATIEAICNHETITGSNLDTKIKRLASNGLISKDDEKKLHAIRFIGNDAAHDVKAPLKNQVIIALKIIQHLISSKYGMQDEINKYLELPISTYEEFKIMLNKKIRNGILSNTFTLQTLIGKDKRRLDQNNILTFIQQYESEIQGGTNQLLEDVTSQIQASTSNENTITQKIYKIKSN